MEEKKNVVITFRVDQKTKEKMDKMAASKEWSISKVAEYICKDYFKYKEIYNQTPAEAIKKYHERIEEEIGEIPLNRFTDNEDLINEVFRLIEIAKEE